MAIISVVVPVYNVEKYLSKCIESVMNQTIEDIEIILVDDGSKDHSGEICDQYAARDKRIKVVHKENGGLSSARNLGIEHSTSEYIGFVDSDDYISSDMYEVLYNNIKREYADISMCDLVHCYDGKNENKSLLKEYCVWDSKEAIKVVMEAKKTSVTAVNKLYRKELFSEIRYPLNRISEDAFVIIDLLLKAKKIVFTSEKKYYYVHRKNSITTSAFKIKDLDVIDAYEKNYKLIVENYPELEDTAKMRCMWANFYVLDKWCLSDAKETIPEIKKIIRELKKEYSFIVKDPRFNKSRKIAVSVLMINKYLYKMCVRIGRKKYVD